MNKDKYLIVFDMDGVLVDVSGSYRETVHQSARYFLKPAAGANQLPDPLFPLSDLATVKQGGGLNNDWDLTCRVLELLFTRIQTPAATPGTSPWEIYGDTIPRCDVSDLARHLTGTARPLSDLAARRQPDQGFIRRLYTGDVGSGNVIKQIFQEIYLGKDLFASTYGLQPRVYDGRGFIEAETLLATPEWIARLAAGHILAVATGRPGAEAAHALKRFGIERYFERIYTLDDCLEEETRIFSGSGRKVSLSKPDPFMLDAIARDVKMPVAGRWYVGDMPDDMTAAARSRSGYKSIGVLASAPNREALGQRLAAAGADEIIEDLAQLNDLLIESGPGAGGRKYDIRLS